MTQDLFLKELQASPYWESFCKWYKQEYLDEIPRIDLIPIAFQLAALVGWLDSEGVHVCPVRTDNGWFCSIEPKNRTLGFKYFPSRPEATRAGILKAITLLP